LKRHRLRREIISTAITNSLINRMGPVFLRVQDDTGAEPRIARAYSIAREVFAARAIGRRSRRSTPWCRRPCSTLALLQTARLLRPRNLLAARKPAQRLG